MKNTARNPYATRGWVGPLGLTAALAIGLNASAQTTLWQGHADVGVNYESGAWDLHVHHHDLGEFEPGEVILGVDITGAHQTVPAGAQWSFLGSPGASVWVLPQNYNPALLFLGLGTEELADGIFVGDTVTLSLVGVSGPGNFSVYTTSGLGTPTVRMNSGDGISGADSIALLAGGHTHVNWAFTAPGTYQVDFSATGELAGGGGLTSSGPVTYTFEVAPIPEPGSAAVLGLGLAALALARAKRRPAA
jgi:surface-anchored protein